MNRWVSMLNTLECEQGPRSPKISKKENKPELSWFRSHQNALFRIEMLFDGDALRHRQAPKVTSHLGALVGSGRQTVSCRWGWGMPIKKMVIYRFDKVHF